MTFLRKWSLPVAGLALGTVLIAGEVWCLAERIFAARAGTRRLQQKSAELIAVARLVPPPGREVATAIEADLDRARRALAAMQDALKGRGPESERLHAAKIPAARTDAYFDLAAFVERTRQLARNHGVDVRPEAAQFGFATHANEAPELERIPVVFRQRQIAQYLIEALLEARPRALVSITREFPLTAREREERDAAAAAAARGERAPEPAANRGGADFFALDPRASVRAPGVLDATAFRLTFIGQTDSLRTFLNRLASFELPVLVREVEVEPATLEESVPVTAATDDTISGMAAPDPASVVLTVNLSERPDARRGSPVAPAVAPIVARPFSRFTVTVEYVELLPPLTPSVTPPTA
jgi:hypothetical protein